MTGTHAPFQFGGNRISQLLDPTDRADDDLGKVIARTGSPWSVETAAIANGIEPTAALRAGDPIKVAASRAYAGRGH